MTAFLYDQDAESTARRVADTSTVAEQLRLAADRWPDLPLHDDVSSTTLGDVWRNLDGVASDLVARSSGQPCILRPVNTLAGVAQILAAFMRGLRPVILVPSAAEPDLGYLQDALDAGRVPSDTACFLTTGGTTGRPKIIPRSHSSYLQTAWLCARNAALVEGDVYLTPLPIAHNYALACPGILGSILFGVPVAVSHARSYPETVAAVRRVGATVVPVVPSMPRQWSGSEQQETGVRLMQVGGAPVSPSDVATLRRLFGCEVQTSFGMAEGLLCQSAPGDGDEFRLAGIGQTLSADDEYRIVNPRPDGAGELEVRGPYTITGYVAGEEVNVRKFTKDGWLRTGDLATAVDPRRFRVLSRADDMINRGGDLIDPAAVEALVATHPGVRGVAVVGRPHPVFETVVVAAVELAGHTTPDEVMRWLRSTHPSETTLPDSVVRVDTIVKTAMGKTNLDAVRQALGINVSDDRRH